MKVYLLYHYREEDNDEMYKLCGVYSSQEAVDAAIQRFLPKPGFKDYPNQFLVSGYEVDKDEWSEGFGFDPEEE